MGSEACCYTQVMRGGRVAGSLLFIINNNRMGGVKSRKFIDYL